MRDGRRETPDGFGFGLFQTFCRLRGVCARNGLLLFVCADNTHHCASMTRVFRAFLRPPQAAEEFFEAFLQTCFVSFTGIF